MSEATASTEANPVAKDEPVMAHIVEDEAPNGGDFGAYPVAQQAGPLASVDKMKEYKNSKICSIAIYVWVLIHFVFVGVTIWAVVSMGSLGPITLSANNTDWKNDPEVAAYGSVAKANDTRTMLKVFLILMIACMAPFYLLLLPVWNMLCPTQPKDPNASPDDPPPMALGRTIHCCLQMFLMLGAFGSWIFGNVAFFMCTPQEGYNCREHVYEAVALMWIVIGWINVAVPLCLCCTILGITIFCASLLVNTANQQAARENAAQQAAR